MDNVAKETTPEEYAIQSMNQVNIIEKKLLESITCILKNLMHIDQAKTIIIFVSL